MSSGRIPSTYELARDAFRSTADQHGWTTSERTLDERGPLDLPLTIDMARFGPRHPRRALVVLSGVHGVEGFIGSAVQCDVIGRLNLATADDSVVLVHAVNPWGMAWLRRQNEHNVDLNRNWGRDTTPPQPNGPYEELHPLLCPSELVLGDHDEFLRHVAEYVRRHGIEWVATAVSAGQYTHADGMHFGGQRTEASTTNLASLVTDEIVGAESVFVVDLHTGHGKYGTFTILTGGLEGSRNHSFLRTWFPAEWLEATSGLAPGRLAAGLADVLPRSLVHSATVEFGTASGTKQLLASREELWVNEHGDRQNPEHLAAVERYYRCFNPDDDGWERGALEQGRSVLDASVAAAFGQP